MHKTYRQLNFSSGGEAVHVDTETRPFPFSFYVREHVHHIERSLMLGQRGGGVLDVQRPAEWIAHVALHIPSVGFFA